MLIVILNWYEEKRLKEIRKIDSFTELLLGRGGIVLVLLASKI